MGLTTSSGITYREFDGYTESGARDRFTATRLLDVAWSSRLQFLIDMLGYPAKVGSGSSATLSRKLPDQHPFKTNLWAFEYELVKAYGNERPSQDSFENIVYDFATYRMTYRSVQYAVFGDSTVQSFTYPELMRFVERKPKFSIRNIKIPGGGFGWAEIPSSTANEVGAKTILIADLEYKWMQVPFIPWNAIKKYAGQVNSVVFDQQGFNCPVGTVLFDNVEAQLNNLENGLFAWDISYHFKQILTQGYTYGTTTLVPMTWNNTFAKDAIQLLTLQDKVNSRPLYQSGDLHNLFSYTLD